jgi:hypothetical protein
MQGSMLAGAVLAAALVGRAMAAPSVEITQAAARVTVIPEARADIAVFVVKTNPRLPLAVNRVADHWIVRGNVGHMANCGGWGGRPGVSVWLRGRFSYEDLPRVVIRAPLDTRISAGEAVFGAIGRARTVDFDSHGCGDWTIGDVAGPMRLNVSGSGDVRTGALGSAQMHASGSGNITTQAIRGGLQASISGSSDITAAAVSGPLDVHVGGSGDVRIPAGRVTTMNVAVSGSGDVRFGGVAGALNADVAGSGDVSVGAVTGPIVKHVAGSGNVRVGR